MKQILVLIGGILQKFLNNITNFYSEEKKDFKTKYVDKKFQFWKMIVSTCTVKLQENLRVNNSLVRGYIGQKQSIQACTKSHI